jgi:hypothetical protein
MCPAQSDLVYGLGQIWSIGGKVTGVNSQLLASPLLALLYLRLAYLTWVWMHLLGSIHTLVRQSSFFIA